MTLHPSLCVDVDALQRVSRSLDADAEVLANVDVHPTTDRAGAALPSSATGVALASLPAPVHAAYLAAATRLRDIATGIEHHVRTCAETDRAAAHR